jgi:N,N-dimethylformamidase
LSRCFSAASEPDGRPTMKIVGYTERWTVQPGENLGIKVSSEVERYYARLVRHVGPIGSAADWDLKVADQGVQSGPHVGRSQPIKTGSYFVAQPDKLPPLQSLKLVTRVFPTSVGVLANSICALGFGSSFVELQVAADSTPALSITGFDWATTFPLEGIAVRSGRWQEVTFAIDRSRHRFMVTVDESKASIGWPDQWLQGSESWDSTGICVSLGSRVVAGEQIGNFDGKIESPYLYLYQGDPEQGDLEYRRFAHWNFASRDMSSCFVADVIGSFSPGRLVNGPMRGVTSSQWNGTSTNYTVNPTGYDAVKFHRDDLSDCGWSDDFTLTIPATTRSGIYSLILSEHQEPDWNDRTSFDALPIFVIPARRSGCRIALLLPTFSYRAYANSIFFEDADDQVFRLKRLTPSEPLYRYAQARGLRSLYDLHEDGSGCHLATLSRPQMTVRADFVSMLQGFPHQLSADLDIVGFLEAQDEPFEILTDEHVHAHCAAALAAYDVVVTGSHPEYTSAPLLDAYRDYASSGGSIVYLGGNGFYWPVAFSEGPPSLLEVRRTRGTWRVRPGETIRQLDGQPGGLWRELGRPPNLIFAVGFSAVGFNGDGQYYATDELDTDLLPDRLRAVMRQIGSRPFGVAGLELDAYSNELGSSPEAIVLASIRSMPPGYVPPAEEIAATEQLLPRPEEALRQLVRGDITLQRLSSGGMIFSAGSIRWSSGLSDAADSFHVRAVTAAVILDFLELAADRT